VTAIVLVDTNVFNADLWIAATAIRWRIPVIAHDAVFDRRYRLEPWTELSTRPAN